MRYANSITHFITALALFCAVIVAASPAPAAGPEIEKPSAVSGYGYTVIGRVFLGDGGNLSYLRFLNLSGSSSTVTATLVGSPSGRNYGSVNVAIPNHASRQIPISQFMSDAGVSGLISPDDRLGVYLRSDGAPVAVQHILYSQSSGFFENMSTCQNSSVSDSNAALMNVHTTSISEYVSYVTIYNYAATSVSYQIQVFEAATGAFKGQVAVTIDPNSTFEQPFEWFQEQLDWTPSASEFHANIVAFPQSGSRSGLIFHTVLNNRQGVYLNLTNFCTIETSGGTLPVANNDNITSAVVGQSLSIPFATLTANDQNAAGAALADVSSPLTSGATNGTLTQSGNELSFTPARAGIATFQYRIRTSAGTSSFATVTVNVSDGAPVADGDRLTQTFTAGEAATIPLSSLIANDHNTAGATLANVTTPLTEGTANGNITQTGEGLSYTPVRNGTVTFQYQLRNSLGTSNAATVALTVGSGATPVAANDTLTQTFSVGQQTSIALTSLTANDRNATGATIENVTTPTTDGTGNGTISRTNDGLIYTPIRQGTATFSYQLRNAAGLSNLALVTLTVSNAAVVPVTANDTLTQTFVAGQSSTIPLSSLTANDRNATGAFLGTLTTPTTDGAANGTLTPTREGITYTPARAGAVTFTYFIYTSAGVSNVSQVALTVGGGDLVPVTSNDTLTQTFAVGQPTTIPLSTLTANDKNTTNGILENLSTPTTGGAANGTLSRTGDGILYTPARTGTVTFTYQIRTRAGISNAAQVTLTVSGGDLVPVTSNDTLTQAFVVNQASTITLASLTANDRNATGAFLGTLTTPTTDGTANGTLTATRDGIVYTPARSGRVTFTYFIYTNAGASNVSLVTLTVSGGDAVPVPVTVADTLTQTFVVNQAATISVATLTANDRNTSGSFLGTLTTPTTNGVANGTLTVTREGIVYTPARAGPVTFTYFIYNNSGISNISEVRLTVNGLN